MSNTFQLDVKAATKTEIELDDITENEDIEEGRNDNNDSDYSSEYDELSDVE